MLLELGVYDKKLENVNLDIEFLNNARSRKIF